MGWFSRRKEEEVEVAILRDRLEKAFTKLASERQQTFRWLDFFYNQNKNLHETINNQGKVLPTITHDTQTLQQYMSIVLQQLEALQRNSEMFQKRLMAIEEFSYRRQVGPDRQEIRTLIDDYYQHHELFNKIDSLHQKISHFHETHSPIPQKVEQMHERLSALEEKKQPQKSNFKEKLISQLARNSKDYVKNLLISYIRKYQDISALKLKEMIVDEQGLCSKSSFYRILEEIEGQEEISVVREGKEKRYYAGLTKSA